MGEAITRKYGPLPAWAWGLVVMIVAFVYLQYSKKKKQAAAQQQVANNNSTNLGTTPVSNLTQQAQPMPIQLGDTFINTGQGGGITSASGSPATTLVTPTASNSMNPASVPQVSPATSMGTA